MTGTSLTGTIASTTLYEYGTLSAAGTLTPGTTLARVTKYEGTDTTSTGTKLSQTEYRYDVAGRTAEVKVDSFGTSPTSITTQFTYDQAGSRLSQRVTEGGVTKTTLYTVDANNPTGYAQVIEERTTTSGASGTQVRTSYTIGLDVIAQQSAERSETSPGTWSPWQQQELRTLLYDGHGSTRAVMVGTGEGAPNSIPPILPAQIAPGQLFTYDAYGQMLPRFNGTSEITVTPLTTLLYSGEQTDASTGLQYLRARYYSPSIGRFTTMDPFAGLQSDPQSLHKYLYAHANPIMNADPSGESILSALSIGINIFSAALNFTLSDIAYDKKYYVSFVYHRNFAYLDLAAIMIELIRPTGGIGGLAYAGATALKFSLVAAERSAALANGIRVIDTLSIGLVSLGFGTTSAAARSQGLTGDTFFSKSTTGFSEAAKAPDTGEYTVAGRSLTKHGQGARPGNNLYPKATGNPRQINTLAQQIVEEILEDPQTKQTFGYRGRFGKTIEFDAPDGRGLVYNSEGRFLFFKE